MCSSDLVLSERPGRVVEEIKVDLPDRDNPIARRAHPRAGGLISHLFELMRLEERTA